MPPAESLIVAALVIAAVFTVLALIACLRSLRTPAVAIVRRSTAANVTACVALGRRGVRPRGRGSRCGRSTRSRR